MLIELLREILMEIYSYLKIDQIYLSVTCWYCKTVYDSLTDKYLNSLEYIIFRNLHTDFSYNPPYINWNKLEPLRQPSLFTRFINRFKCCVNYY